MKDAAGPAAPRTFSAPTAIAAFLLLLLMFPLRAQNVVNSTDFAIDTRDYGAGSWQEVRPNPGALTAADGITRLEEAKSPQRQFYRLHREAPPP